MVGFKFLGILAVVPTIMLLTVSFFVLFTIRKLDSRRLKVFGYVIAFLLWISATIVFTVGIYIMSKGYPVIPMRHRMMKEGMNYPMMEGPRHGEEMMRH